MQPIVLCILSISYYHSNSWSILSVSFHSSDCIIAIVTFSCFCVVAVGGIAAWQNGLLSYDGTKMESAPAGNSDSLEGSLLMGSEDYIIVNELESVIDEDSKVASEVQDQDFVEMTREELIAYFGINVFPELPLDVVEHGSRYGVYKMEQ